MRSVLSFCLSVCASSTLACAQVTQEEPPSRGGGGLVPGGMLPATSPSTPGQLPPLMPAAPAPSPSGSNEGNAALRPPAPLPSTPAPSTTIPNLSTSTPAPAPTGPSGEELFFEDFDDGSAQGWIADAPDGDDLVGEWSVVPAEQGFVYAQADDSFDDESWAVGGDVRWTDIAVDTRFRFTNVQDIEDATVMLALRFRSREDFYYLEYGGDGSVKIRTEVDGSDSEVSSEELDRTAVVGEWINLRLVVQGSALRAFIDGTPAGTGTADAVLASGGIALGTQENAAVEFDDVRVTRP